MSDARRDDRGIAVHERPAGAPDRVPGELLNDSHDLARDHGECDACGAVELLAPGSALCPVCEDHSRAVAEAAARARAQGTMERVARAAPARRHGSHVHRSDPSSAVTNVHGSRRPPSGISRSSSHGFPHSKHR